MGAMALWPAQVIAQAWPQRPVRMIVPVAPGSSPDVAARIFAERLKARWAQPVIVENRPGADGLIGTAAFAAAQDDHTLLFSFAAPLTVYPAIHEKLSYHPMVDVIPISMTAETFGTITVPASLPVRTLPEFVEWARTHPGQLNWTSGGGAFPVLFAGFARSAKLELTEVPYRDQNLAVQDTAAGRIQVIVTPITAVLPLVQAGKLRVLAVTNRTRSPMWLDIPTATESGYPELAFEGLLGVFGPRGMSDELRARISADIRAVAADASVAERLATNGQLVRASTPEEFAAAIQEQRTAFAAAVGHAGRPK
ncbi:MAG: tripartite tricarboxylate transporter substrate binding protein [Alphaproteobacteria bacterium]|nr:MAG: tripartite tricarboxylate transporter substrate binding protein [Alphaproteobacteria bacterium]